MLSIISKIWDELKTLFSWINKYYERRVHRNKTITYLQGISDEQRSALKACFDLPSRLHQPFYWQDSDIVLIYLGFFLEEKMIIPMKYPQPGTTGYRFDPWFYNYLKKNPEVFVTLETDGQAV